MTDSPLSKNDRAAIEQMADDPIEYLRIAAWDSFKGHADNDRRRDIACETLVRLLLRRLRDQGNPNPIWDDLAKAEKQAVHAVDHDEPEFALEDL